ncbi:MAG: hypothetical protein J3K34DRAFT_522766 [Monoraphidium minutum]|nr:MAG: hypothetical protein J3K34DRAFT_522766 [Monoraphidium minutum]
MAKKVVILTSGSRGDVQPYVALGLELEGRGASVSICTEARQKAFVESFGLKYAELAGDPFGLLAVLSARARAKLLAEGKIMKVMAAAGKHNAPFADAVLASAAAACGGADVVVTAALTQTPSMCVAEKLGVPWVPVFLGPVWPTREFCSWALSTQPWRWKWANKASYKLLLGALWMQEKTRINKWRTQELGLRALAGGPMAVASSGEVPVVLMCTPHATPGQARPPDYPEFVQYTGFAFVPPADEAAIELRLREFIAAGAAPVYLGFGSMPAPEPQRLLRLAAEVVRLTGKRAVLAAGWSGVNGAADGGSGGGGGEALPPELLVVAAAPHDWLLPRCCAAVHHAGIGTCAAALRAGVPSVPCPVMLDQPWNAARLVEAGCAGPPLPFMEMTAEALAARINAVSGDDAMRARARAVADDIATGWRGAAAAADAVLAAPNPWPKLAAARVV